MFALFPSDSQLNAAHRLQLRKDTSESEARGTNIAFLCLQVSMLRNITYNNPDIKAEINALVGPPFGLISSIKMGGIGSRRMLITEASPDIRKWLSLQTTAPYCYLELRPSGIIVHFRSILETMGWVIPFHHLSIFRNGEAIHLHGAGSFMHLSGVGSLKPDHKFIEKVLGRKQCARESDPF
ncbi:MAG: hypothetical protein EA392_07105 [Cryomorphaceae bacterium]|nr:MAG: hypothetical protein EA392_07105 [Cryomorphaceae bacterium]